MTRSSSFRKVAKGGILFSLGTVTGTFLQFLAGIIVIRMVEPFEYGLISLGMTAVTMLSVLSMLGFKIAIPRFLAKYRTQSETGLASEVVGTAFGCSAGISCLFAALLHSQAGLAALIFRKPEMLPVLEILALMLPAIVLVNTFSAIFQGTENARAKVLFEDLGLNLLRLGLLLALLMAGLGFHEVLWVYVASVWLALTLYFGYAVGSLRGTLHPRFSLAVAKELLWFSFPLLGISIIGSLSTWIATLTLGYLRPSAELGVFSAPLRLTAILTVPLVGMTYLYLPIATRLSERGTKQEVQDLYQSTTKWAFLVTLPFLAYFLIDAEFVVTFLFGPAYRDAANILRVMVVGLSIHTFVGPNGITQVAFGNTLTQFVATMVGSLVAIFLCLVLIPHYGALGAAVAMAAGRAVSNLFVSVALFREFGIHPLVPAYVKPVLLTVAAAAAAGTFFHSAHLEGLLTHLLLFFGIATLSIAAPLLTRALSDTDLELIGLVERRVRGDTRFTERIRRWMVGKSA